MATPERERERVSWGSLSRCINPSSSSAIDQSQPPSHPWSSLSAHWSLKDTTCPYACLRTNAITWQTRIDTSRECKTNLIGIACKGIVLAPSGSVSRNIPENGRRRNDWDSSSWTYWVQQHTVRPRPFIQQLVLAGYSSPFLVASSVSLRS